MEPTGVDASVQNGLSERPNRTLGEMMQCILNSADLGPEYWSYAILHAAYLKNRLTQSIIKTSPCTVITGNTPGLSKIRIFGSRLYAKNLGKRPAKLDHHTATRIFLGVTAMNKNIKYIDNKSE